MALDSVEERKMVVISISSSDCAGGSVDEVTSGRLVRSVEEEPTSSKVDADTVVI